MKKLVWGMIGCGDVTEVKNGPGLYRNENCELKAITNRTYEKAVDWAARHNQCTVYRTVDELLADPEIEAVYIATTPDVHLELALKCARAGKHVYIDKPVALNYEEAVQILECCKENGVRAFVAHYRRGLPQFVYARRLIVDGAIGELTTARIMTTCTRESIRGWRMHSEIAGGGHLFETDIHAIDALDYLVGPYESITVDAEPYADDPTMEKAAACLFRWKNGMVGSGMWFYAADHSADLIEIFGTRGSITVSSGDLSMPLILTQDGKRTEIPFEMPENVGMEHERLVAEAILSGEENTEICTLENAMRTLKLACTVMQKIRK